MHHIYKYCFICLAVCISVLVSGCASADYGNFSNRQAEAIEERLEGYSLGGVRQACDGCNFLARDTILKQSNKVNKEHTELSRSKSGIRLYIFEKMTLEDSLIALLDSNIFSKRMNRNYKEALIELISEGGNDFNQKDGESNMSYEAFSSLSFAKRRNSPSSEPKAYIDSVDVVQKSETGRRYSDSLEAFILPGEIVIIHYYTQNEVWKKY